MKRQNIIALAIIVIVAIAAVTAYVLVTMPGATEKSEITIGAAMSLTGSNGAMGSRFKQGYDIWEAMTNERGGMLIEGTFYPVKLIIYDDKSDPTTTATLYERLITVDNVDFIIGPFSSSCAMTMSPIAEEHQLVNIQPSSNAPAVYSQGWQWIFMGDIEGKADDLARPFFEFLASLPADQKPKTIATATLANVYTEAIVDNFDEWCNEFGFEWILNEPVPSDVKDMTGVISKIQAANPDVFMDIVFQAQGVLTARAMDELGYTPPIYYEQLAYNPDFYDNVGDLAHGALAMVDWSVKGDFYESTPFTKMDFINYYENLYGKKPDSFPAKAFAGLQLLQQAAESVGTIDDIIAKNHVQIRDYLRNNDHLTIVGTYSFRADGSCAPSSRVGQVSYINGDVSVDVIFPASSATSTFIYPYNP